MIALDCALIRHLRIGLRLPPHAEMTSVIAPSSDAECSPPHAEMTSVIAPSSDAECSPHQAEMTSVIAPSSDAECSPHQAGVVRAMCYAEVQAIPVGSHGND
jgi:hypothetical protein